MDEVDVVNAVDRDQPAQKPLRVSHSVGF